MNCIHLDQIEILNLPEHIWGCEDCIATGGRWVHLRMRQSCGKVGCCDCRNFISPIGGRPGTHSTCNW